MRAATAQYLESLSDAAPGSAGQPVVAFFDLDRTLIDGYSLTALAWQELFNGDMGPLRFLSLGVMFLKYGLGRLQYEDMLQATVDDITGITEEELAALGRQAYERRLARWMYGEGLALVEAHKKRGHEVVMVTSATSYQAQPVAERLGIDRICCTELEIVDGRVAGGVETCYGAGKVTAAKAYVEEIGAELADAYFYSDSLEDLPLLETVGNPVVVNGKPRLVELGTARGWPLLEFEDKGSLAEA